MSYSIKTTALSLAAMVGAAGLLSWLLWWSTLAGPDEASAQAVVDRACNQMAWVRSYDATGTVKGYENGRLDETLTLRLRVEGDDYHVRYTARSDGATADYRRVNGVGYYRDSTEGNRWRVMTTTRFRDPGENLGGLGDNPICPLTSNLRSFGSAFDAGQQLRRYGSPEGMGRPAFQERAHDVQGLNGGGQQLRVLGEQTGTACAAQTAHRLPGPVHCH